MYCKLLTIVWVAINTIVEMPWGVGGMVGVVTFNRNFSNVTDSRQPMTARRRRRHTMTARRRRRVQSGGIYSKDEIELKPLKSENEFVCRVCVCRD